METVELKAAAKLIKSGKVGIIPTDTLYGIVASALNETAVNNVYQIKGRDKNKPSIILISSMAELSKFGVSSANKKLAKLFWPGQVSVILPCESKKWHYLHRGKKSLAFRMPASKNLRKFLKHAGPIVAPSANPQGKPPATSIKKAKAYFGRQVDFYVDGGQLNNSPSTLISLLENDFKILRRSSEDVETYAKFLKLKARKGVSMHLGGFLDFIREKGVIGLATGIIIGTAVTALVRALVDQIINPLVGLIVDARSLEEATFNIGEAVIGWGAFMNALINFIIIAAVVYFGFKLLKLEKLDKKQ